MEDVGEKRMEARYGRGIPGVVPGRIPGYRVEANVEKIRFWAHFGHSQMRPSGYFDEPLTVCPNRAHEES